MAEVAEIGPPTPRDDAVVDELLHVLYPGSSHRFAARLASDGVDILLAKEIDKPVGLVVATFVHDGWEPYGMIDQLVVRPEQRGRGIGRQLVTAARERLVDRGAVVVFVTTNTDEAKAFYRRVGFDESTGWLGWAPSQEPSPDRS